MLNYNELKKLEELKKQLHRKLGIIDYELSDSELRDIFQEIAKYSEKDRTKYLWQQIVKQQTRITRFSLYEALEFSDINYVHQQIQDLLNKK